MNPWHNTRLLNLISALLSLCATLALIGAGLWWLLQRPMFDLRSVKIEAAPGFQLRYAASPLLRQAAQRAVKGNFFTVDLDGVRSSMETVPWVRHASVRRIWPNELRIDVEEHRALGIWGHSRLINIHGELFSANIGQAEEDGALPTLSGPPNSEAMVFKRYDELRRWLSPLDRMPEVVSLSERYAWTVTLDDGTQLVLGRDQGVPIEERIKRWVSVFPEVAQRFDRKAQWIDLRYQSGFAVRSVKLLPEDPTAGGKGDMSVARLGRVNGAQRERAGR